VIASASVCEWIRWDCIRLSLSVNLLRLHPPQSEWIREFIHWAVWRHEKTNWHGFEFTLVSASPKM